MNHEIRKAILERIADVLAKTFQSFEAQSSNSKQEIPKCCDLGMPQAMVNLNYHRDRENWI
jgi:hypothetical protein